MKKGGEKGGEKFKKRKSDSDFTSVGDVLKRLEKKGEKQSLSLANAHDKQSLSLANAHDKQSLSLANAHDKQSLSLAYPRDKYISREFQKYGYDLAEELNDLEHKSLYIKLAKETPRGLLETAKNFVKDAHEVKSKAKLFMWKLSELKKQAKLKHKRGAGVS